MKCIHCNKDIEMLNYCPHCGNPLNESAKELENIKLTNARLEVLLKISELTDDEKTLVAIKNLIIKLKDNNKKED